MPCDCIVLGCKSRWSPGSNVIFHRFPKDEERRKQWLDSVAIKCKLYKSASLCSLHFSAEDYSNGGRLKPNACPRVTTADGKCRLFNKDNIDDIVTVEKPGYLAILPLVTNPGPEEVQACRGCLDTGGGQVELCGEMEEVFSQLTGLLVQGGSLCSICLQLLRKFNGFRQRCRDINKVLSEIPVVTEEALKNVDIKHLKHNYSRSDLLNIVCDPCIPEKSDPLIEENLIYMDDDTKIELDNLKYDSISISDSDNELNKEFKMKHIIDFDGVNINDDMVTVVDEAANKTNDHQIESDDDFIWPENNDNSEEDDAEINTTTTEQTNNKKNRNTCFNEAKKPHLEDEKLKHRRSIVVSPDNVPMATLMYKWISVFRRLRKFFRLEEDPFVLFESIHKESVLLKSGQSDSEETVSKSMNVGDKIKEAALKRNLREFLDLNDQYADLLGVDVDFVSLYSQQRAMDERRGQAPPAPFCGLCCKTYNHVDTYERHFHFAHNKNHPMECSVCKYRLVSQWKLNSHLLRHARRFTCRECGAAMFMATGSVKQVREHLSTHRGRSFSCELCGNTLVNKKAYYSHVKNWHSNQVNSVKCQLCDDTFYQDRGVRVHMNRMHNQAVQCAACEVWFIDSSALHTHTEAGCQPGQNSPCPGCGSSFESAALMKEHYIDVHKKYTCRVDKCRKNILGLQAYNAHMNNGHLKSRRSMKSENSVENTKEVEKKRRKEINRSLVCEHCGKNNFICPAGLRDHQRIHTGEKPYKCDHCSRRFRLKQAMRVHIRTHIGEKNYKCKLCTKTFRQDTHLRYHLRTHTKERPYPCNVCGRRFALSGNLKAHKRTVHEGFPPRKRTKRVRSKQSEDVA